MRQVYGHHLLNDLIVRREDLVNIFLLIKSRKDLRPDKIHLFTAFQNSGEKCDLKRSERNSNLWLHSFQEIIVKREDLNSDNRKLDQGPGDICMSSSPSGCRTHGGPSSMV